MSYQSKTCEAPTKEKIGLVQKMRQVGEKARTPTLYTLLGAILALGIQLFQNTDFILGFVEPILDPAFVTEEEWNERVKDLSSSPSTPDEPEDDENYRPE